MESQFPDEYKLIHQDRFLAGNDRGKMKPQGGKGRGEVTNTRDIRDVMDKANTRLTTKWWVRMN